MTKSDEVQQHEARRAERVVVVEAASWVDLLVSRRKLERVGNGEGRLHDLETDETFVMKSRLDDWLAKGA